MLVNQENFRIGGGVVTPPAGEKAIFCDTDGSFKSIDSAATEAALGGGSSGDPGVLVTLGADTQDWDFATGLIGDTDGDYRISLNVIADASGRTYTLMPNGANPTSSNGSYIYDNCAGPTMTANANQANSLVCGISNSGSACEIRIDVESKSGRIRIIRGTFFTDTSIVASSIVAWFQYVWLDNATALTSLRLHGSTAASIKATSTARIQKLGFLA